MDFGVNMITGKLAFPEYCCWTGALGAGALDLMLTLAGSSLGSSLVGLNFSSESIFVCDVFYNPDGTIFVLDSVTAGHFSAGIKRIRFWHFHLQWLLLGIRRSREMVGIADVQSVIIKDINT
ncbi:hypothetical protein CEXT_524011 [Caerostris extrusa]|uniref:Uncharacterized protein n=1 Tax=Caerostris extrusa TaxID=172846 RepID=A0AAV4P545_CAEEX|nr:hypothetical protein CEXT_524011 [Caerostris extrusa]